MGVGQMGAKGGFGAMGRGSKGGVPVAIPASFVLREDGFKVLREDASRVQRQGA